MSSNLLYCLKYISLMSKKVYKKNGQWKVFSDRKYVQLETVQVNYVVKTVRMQYCVYYEIYLNSLYYKPNKKRVKSIFVHISDFNYQVVSNILYSLEYFECQSLNDLSPCSSFVTFTWWRAKEILLELQKRDSKPNSYKILSRLKELVWFKYFFCSKKYLEKCI